jgi:hypothetical protein
MLDTNRVGQITYNDQYPQAYDATKSYVKSFTISGRAVDFTDASTYYRVSTVNYLAAGSCNFNDGGVSLWPLDQIVNDTQYYVRDAVIDYLAAMGTVSPAIEGRLVFLAGDIDGPVVTTTAPAAARAYLHSSKLKLAFGATDPFSGMASISAKLDAKTVRNGQTIDLLTLRLGTHRLTVTARDVSGNTTVSTTTFTIKATTSSTITSVNRLYAAHRITSHAVRDRLVGYLSAARRYESKGWSTPAVMNMAMFTMTVARETYRTIKSSAGTILIDDAVFVMKSLRHL